MIFPRRSIERDVCGWRIKVGRSHFITIFTERNNHHSRERTTRSSIRAYLLYGILLRNQAATNRQTKLSKSTKLHQNTLRWHSGFSRSLPAEFLYSYLHLHTTKHASLWDNKHIDFLNWNNVCKVKMYHIRLNHTCQENGGVLNELVSNFCILSS